MSDRPPRTSITPCPIRSPLIAATAALLMLAGIQARGQDGPPPDILTEAVLTEVEFRGRVNVDLPELEARSGLKKGAKVDLFQVGKGVQDVLNLYREKGFVGTEAKLIEGDRPGATRVVIEIIEGTRGIPDPLAVPPPGAIPVVEEGKSLYNQSFGPDGMKVGDAFQHARSEEFEQANVHLDLARQARKARKFKDALAESTAAIRLMPNSTIGYQERSEIYSDMGLHRRAIADLTKAIELEPKAVYYLVRGYTYCLDRDYERGLADVDVGFSKSSGPGEMVDAYYCRAKVRMHRGEHDLAVPDFDRAIEFGQDMKRAALFRGLSLAKIGEHDRAIADFDRVIAINPTAFAWYSRAESEFARGNFARAQSDFDRAIELDPEVAGYRVRRTWAMLARGQVDAAIEDFTRDVEIVPKKPRTDRAWKITDHKPSTRNTLAITGRGWAYLTKRDLDRAIKDFDEAIALQNPGIVLFAGGDFAKTLSLYPRYDRAVSEFEERCRSAPNIPFALVFLAGDQARSQDLKNPYFAAYLVGRTRASSEVAPNFLIQVAADWRTFPDQTSALAGRAVAAMLRSDWPDSREHLMSAMKSLVESQHPGQFRPALVEILHAQ